MIKTLMLSSWLIFLPGPLMDMMKIIFLKKAAPALMDGKNGLYPYRIYEERKICNEPQFEDANSL